jgi:hypothetical protein
MMNCMSTPEITDTELMKYLDHLASVEVISHVNSCEYCQGRIAQLRRLQEQLSHDLHRMTCPTPVILGEYHLELLTPRQAASVREHVELCPHCQRELEQLDSYLDDLSLQMKPTPIQHIQILVAQLVDSATQSLGHTTGSPLSPVLLGAVRDEDQEDHPSVYRVNDVEIVIEAQSEFPGQDKKTVLGFVRGLNLDSLNVLLWRGEEPIAAVEVDEQGHFVFEHVPAGVYDLAVRDADLEVHVREISL